MTDISKSIVMRLVEFVGCDCESHKEKLEDHVCLAGMAEREWRGMNDDLATWAAGNKTARKLLGARDHETLLDVCSRIKKDRTREIPKTFEHSIRRVVITDEDEIIYGAEDDDIGCAYIVTPEVMNKEIRPILDGWDQGTFVTDDQIRSAWDLAQKYFDDGFDQVCHDILRVFGIDRCKRCEGPVIRVYPLDDGTEACQDCHDKSICEIECPEEFQDDA